MYALVEILGKQYKAEKGGKIEIDRLPNETGEELQFDSVLMVSDGDTTNVGTPYVAGAKVTAVVEDHGKAKKIKVSTYKRRKNYRRTQGHRRQYSVIRIKEIAG